MFNPAINNFMKDKESYYSLVIAVAKRAREIVDEANENEETLVEKPVSLAVEEFARGEYQIVYHTEPEEIETDDSIFQGPIFSGFDKDILELD